MKMVNFLPSPGILFPPPPPTHFTPPPLPLSGPCLPQAPHPTQLTALYKLDCSPQVETFFFNRWTQYLTVTLWIGLWKGDTGMYRYYIYA